MTRESTLRDGRALAATRREAALDRIATGSYRSKTEGKNDTSGEPAHLLKLDDIHGQIQEAQHDEQHAKDKRS